LPSKLSASTVMAPSCSCRTTRRPQCSQAMMRPLAVAGVAVGVVRGLSEDGDGARLLLPPQDAGCSGCRPEQAAHIAEPDRPLAPAAAGPEAFHRGTAAGAAG
jgi:hypothetical protein